MWHDRYVHQSSLQTMRARFEISLEVACGQPFATNPAPIYPRDALLGTALIEGISESCLRYYLVKIELGDAEQVYRRHGEIEKNEVKDGMSDVQDQTRESIPHPKAQPTD